MVFVRSALLQHQLVFVIEYENRKGPMQHCFLMRLKLRHQSYRLVAFIDKNDIFFFHTDQKYKKSSGIRPVK